MTNALSSLIYLDKRKHQPMVLTRTAPTRIVRTNSLLPGSTDGKAGVNEGEKMYSNAGGYGFWCNSECAAKKDAALKAGQDSVAAQLAAMNALASTSNQGGVNLGLIGIGSALVALTIIGIVLYKK